MTREIKYWKYLPKKNRIRNSEISYSNSLEISICGEYPRLPLDKLESVKVSRLFFVFVLLHEQKIAETIPSRNFIPFEPQKSVSATLKLISYILKTKHTVSAKVLMQHNVWLKFRVFYLNVFWFQTKILKFAFKNRILIRDWNLCFTRQV